MGEVDYNVTYKSKEYPVKEIVLFAGTNDAMRVNVSTEELQNAIYDSDSGYSDSEAEKIDNSIYFFLDNEHFNMGKDDIVEYLERD